MKNKILILLFTVLFVGNVANAQSTEVKISLDEQFFEALLEAVFTHLDEPKVPIADKTKDRGHEKIAFVEKKSSSFIKKASYSKKSKGKKSIQSRLTTSYLQHFCDESIKLKREIDGVRTAVKFINGKIYAPIAFLGNYNPPLIGCIEFSGWAETNIELSFDKSKNALVGRATVTKVNLSGTGGIGSSLLSRFVQSSIDNKVNPIEIISMEKLSFTTPIQNSGKLKMKALGIRHKVNNTTIDVYLKYQFLKG